LIRNSKTAQPISITSDAASWMTPATDEHAHLLDVVGEARQELPGLRLIVVAEAEALNARKQAVAQIERHAL